MKNTKLSAREIVMVLLLIVLVIGVGYYMGFYTPLQEEMASISTQSADIDMQITNSMAKIGKMDQMQAELDEILSRPADEITEIAPYDNKEVVLSQLYGILGQTQEYSLDFVDPQVQPDGTVRRNISMKFKCASYFDAKAVIQDLTESNWRCLVGNLSIASKDSDFKNILFDTVEVSATITFFEHTGLK